jgi:hypothetical protein
MVLVCIFALAKLFKYIIVKFKLMNI